jgi:hypothetical protein
VLPAYRERRKYFQQVAGTFGQTGGFCYRQKSVDSVIEWSEPVTVDGNSQTEVTYRVTAIASWAEQPNIQQAFPDIGSVVNGASNTNQTCRNTVDSQRLEGFGPLSSFMAFTANRS